MHAEVFERWIQAHEEGDTEALAEHMHEEFVFEQEGFPKQLDKEEYLTLVEAFALAFPDLGFEAGTDVVTDEGLIEWQQSLSATHEQDLDLTTLDLPFFVTTGQEVDLAGASARTRIEDGTVREHAIEDPEAGIAGLLAELETGLDALRQEAREHEPKAPGIRAAAGRT